MHVQSFELTSIQIELYIVPDREIRVGTIEKQSFVTSEVTCRYGPLLFLDNARFLLLTVRVVQ